MSSILPHLKADTRPIAAAEAIIQPNGNVRITVLTPRLFRLEYAPDGRFEDRATQTFWYRQQPVPTIATSEKDGKLIIETQALALSWSGSSNEAFDSRNLSILLKEGETEWHFGDAATGNVGGTFRTLDGKSGGVGIDPGLISADGWTVFDDSESLVLDENGWIAPRKAVEGYQDLYFFGHGNDFTGLLKDFAAVAGHAPLIPRYVLGNWWSRYWEYDDAELRELISGFRDRDIPLSVCIIDMDWHTVKEAEDYHSGWTGYTWNKELFDDPAGLMQWLKDQDLRVALNLHPADGVAPHEEMYAEMAEAMGLDPASNQTVPFHIGDPNFVKAYLEVLHHPQEEIGVDFWWMDWQQGKQSELVGLDPLWMLNHIHYLDLTRKGERGLIFSRWHGLGNHRYPIGFSGDTYVTWDSLAFQPYFTATAANVAFGWWSHDIGGHMFGIEEPELYLRWVQSGVFSPVMRLHSTKNRFHERRPWGYTAEIEDLSSAVMRLRHSLIPYLYTMNRRNQIEHLPLVQPIYHNWPDAAESWQCPQEYSFGTELIVAPYTASPDPDTQLSRQVVWFPNTPGGWTDFFTGEHMPGGQWQAVYGGLDHIPVYAKAGAIVPLNAENGWGSLGNPESLDLHIFAGADNTFVLFEDDGISLADSSAETEMVLKHQTQTLEFVIHKAVGQLEHIPLNREVMLFVHSVVNTDDISLHFDGTPIDFDYEYDGEAEMMVIGPVACPPSGSLVLQLAADRDEESGIVSNLLSQRDRTAEKLYSMIAQFKAETAARNELAEVYHLLKDQPELLGGFLLAFEDAHIQALCEVIYDAGFHTINYGDPETTVQMWNNRQDKEVTFIMTKHNTIAWPWGRNTAESRVLPKSQAWKQSDKAFNDVGWPGVLDWQVRVDYGRMFARSAKVVAK
ncbi:MAG: alpha-glucosidase (family GH31 glycosyl hydrolase) [Candidatus Promineifilaceae bacterium]|jgi:alpha-glucosidase (family GH31 glycosyl hydrolase)